MVAKSFQNFEFLSKPYDKNGKLYIDTRNPSTGKERTVRWYSGKEYAQMYPNEKVENTSLKFKNLKNTLGFQHGYITIIAEAPYDDEWCNMSNARYHRYWGWYIVSTETVPEDCPHPTFLLYWKDVAKNEGELKPEEDIRALLYHSTQSSTSNFLGQVGERLRNKKFVITGANPKETDYGTKVTYTLEDSFGNVAQWFTAERKHWKRNKEITISGTVKELITKNSINMTILTRCLEN